MKNKASTYVGVLPFSLTFTRRTFGMGIPLITNLINEEMERNT